MMGMVIGAAVLFILFFCICFLGTGTDRKNMISFYSYPDAVQEKIRENETLRKLIPREKPLYVTLLSNVILFAFAFLVLGMILNLRQFASAFVYFLIVGEGLDIFDLLAIDMCWWRNTPRTKFSAIPDRKLYRNMKKHIASFVRGIPVFALSALIAAEVLSIIPVL